MSKNDGLKKFLIALIFIFLPALVGYYLFPPEWNNKSSAWWVYLVMSIAFFLYALIISIVFIRFRFTTAALLNITLPLTLILVVIFISSSWHLGFRIGLVFVVVTLAYPLNILVDRLEKRWH